MTTLLIPQTDAVTAPAGALPCGCCIPPPDVSVPEGRQRALADLEARRDALERRLNRLR